MAQSLSNILIHLVFSTKHREEYITQAIQAELHSYIAAICKNNGSKAIKIGGMSDHLHILVSLSRTTSVGALVADIKSGSSKWIKSKGEQFEKFAWQAGYGAFSIGESGAKACIDYIANQAEHHKKFTFKEELEKFLQKYNVKVDDRYLFD